MVNKKVMAYEHILIVKSELEDLVSKVNFAATSLHGTEKLPNNEPNSNEVKLKYLGELTRESWPEDIAISLKTDKIFICFYSGNIKKQNLIFNEFIQRLTDLGISVEEEED